MRPAFMFGSVESHLRYRNSQLFRLQKYAPTSLCLSARQKRPSRWPSSHAIPDPKTGWTRSARKTHGALCAMMRTTLDGPLPTQ